MSGNWGLRALTSYSVINIDKMQTNVRFALKTR